MKFKRLFSMLMAIAMILSLLPVFASAAETTTVYFKPGVWNVDGAWFQAWRWGGSTADSWVTFTDSNGDGIYETQIPSDTTGMKILRKASSHKNNAWESWNDSGDQKFSTSNNCFVVKGWGSYGWENYTPVVVPEFNSPIVIDDSVTFNYWNPDATSVHVAGNMNSWSTEANPMTKGEDGIWTTTISGLTNNEYQYKFYVSPAINGNPWITDPKNNTKLIDTNSTFEIINGIIPTEPTRNVTVHYRNTQVWEGSLNAYAWDHATSTFYTKGFPGDEMSVEAEHANWYTVTVALPISATTMDIQFSSGDHKGDPLAISDIPTDAASEYWYDDLTSTEFLTEAPESWADGSVDIPEPELPEKLYLLPNANWVSDGAGFAAYFFNANSENIWVSMVDSNGDGVYEAEVPENMSSVIFCRMDSAATEPSWDSKWNQSDDIVIPTDGTNLFTMSQEAWGKDTESPWAGAWGIYTEPPVIVSPIVEDNKVTISYWAPDANTVQVFGSMNGWKTAYDMSKLEDGSWSVTIDLPYAGVFEYKIVVDGTWTTDPNNPAGLSSDGNSVFSTYDPVAEIYGLGVYYYFAAACEATAKEDDSYVITLLQDITEGDLYSEHEFNLDLNGHNATLSFNSTGAHINVQDSATVEPTATEYGTLIVNGEATYSALGGYVMIPEDQGHSFHSYELSITHISLNPAKDALGFKAQLVGDASVLASVTEIGFAFSVNGGEAKEFKLTKTPEDGIFTARLNNILANNGGEMTIAAAPFVCFGEEKVSGDDAEATMMETLQFIDNNWSSYNQTQKAAVKDLCTKYKDVTDAWNLENIFSIINIPIN